MAWSTRQVAELAGTTVRTVRHYHEVGLLDEPERRTNGYKQYGVVHLVRILRIKRLSGLGFSLSQISAMGAGDEHPEDAVRTLDADLAALIDHLQQARAELRSMLGGVPGDLSTKIAADAEQADNQRVRRLKRSLRAGIGGVR